MSLLVPDSGLLFWMLLSFGLVFFVLARYGFPVITRMVEERREHINNSIQAAEDAKIKLENIRAEADHMLSKAQTEQLRIINDASRTAETIVSDAKQKAIAEGERLLEEAKKQIRVEKENVIREIRSQVAALSVDVAEKIIRTKLDSDTEQVNLVYRMMDELEARKS